MTGQQGGAPGQSGANPPQDQEATQVGMPVPPATPGYTQQPPQAYGQAPSYPPPPPPGYGAQQPGYGAPPPGVGGPPPGGFPPAGYGYQTPPPKRSGPSALVIGAIALALVLVLGVGGMYALGLGPFAPSATPTTGAKLTPTASQPSSTATPTAPAASPSPTETLAPATSAPATTAPATTAPSTTAPATTAPASELPSFTLPPISFPPVSPGPSASPNAVEAALLLHVPEDFRDSCSATPVVQPAVAGLNCNAGLERGIFMSYTQYPDFDSMQAAYEFIVQLYGTDAGSEDCEVAGNWPSEYGYTIDEVHAGRVLCSEFGTLPQMHWTDERFNILTWSFGVGDATKEDMHSFWASEAGPN
jgi:hypothetical protein